MGGALASSALWSSNFGHGISLVGVGTEAGNFSPRNPGSETGLAGLAR